MNIFDLKRIIKEEIDNVKFESEYRPFTSDEISALKQIYRNNDFYVYKNNRIIKIKVVNDTKIHCYFYKKGQYYFKKIDNESPMTYNSFYEVCLDMV